MIRTAAVVLGLLLASSSILCQPVDRKPPLRIDEVSRANGLPAKLGKIYPLTELSQHARPPTTVQQPLPMERNVGQAQPGFGYVTSSVSFAAGFLPTGMTAVVVGRQQGKDEDPKALDGHAFQLRFMGAQPAVLAGEAALTAKLRVARARPGATRFGASSRQPPSEIIPAFQAVSYSGLYPGVRMAASGANGVLRYGFVLEPSAAVGVIRIRVRGVSGLALDSGGNLQMIAPGGTVVQTRPVFTERAANGKTRRLKGGFVLLPGQSYGFEVSGRRPGRALAIDPEIVFQTYVGGSLNEGTLEPDNGATDLHGQGFDIAVGPQSNLYVAGTTTSPDFPVTAVGAVLLSTDAFVLRIDPALPPGQQLRYATFLGGSSFERGVAVAPRPDGSVYVTGCTTSSDFPSSAGALRTTRGLSVGYIARLAPDGAFDIGTLLGNRVVHHPASIVYEQRAGEPDGFVYVAGSIEAPAAGATPETTLGVFQPSFAGGENDGFVAKLDAGLTRLEYLTLLGGTGRDLVRDLAVNGGFAFVTGATSSTNFPTNELANQRFHSQTGAGTNCANDSAQRQCFDAFVTRLGRDGSSLVYSTYQGGNAEEYGRGIAVDANNRATVTGAAKPTTGTSTQIFVARFEGGGENLIWETTLPGSNRDHGEEVVVDALGRAHVVGTISRDGLSTSDALFRGGASDIFYARFGASDGTLEYFTYVGGSGEDRGFAVAAQGAAADRFCAFVAGSTKSQDVATVSPLSAGETNRGGADLLLTALCDLPPQIDLNSGFTKTVSPSAAEVGRSVVFTITVRNGGDTPVGVTVTDSVPTGLNVTGVSGPGCGRTGNTVTCAFNAAPGPTSIDITATVGAAGGCPRNTTNTAAISVAGRQASATANLQINCPPPLCGNGRLDPGELCDSTAGCRSNCTRMTCGDNIRDPGEDCDSGALNAANGRCTLQCKAQTISGDSCRNVAPCAAGLVCGKQCSLVECDRGISILGFCILGDTYLLCDDTPKCMPPNEATYTEN